MLPMELVIHIFSYLGIKPTKRCKATTLKGKNITVENYTNRPQVVGQ